MVRELDAAPTCIMRGLEEQRYFIVTLKYTTLLIPTLPRGARLAKEID
jgi:hypothetical protein